MSLDPNKTYLVWYGTEFPNSTLATFKAPAGSTIDWGDGIVETFDTASETVNTHTYTDGKIEHTIAIGGLTSIDNSVFRSCSSLASVAIGNSVTSIGGWAFANCSSLTSVMIGNSVTSIGGQAFRNCSSLVSVTIGNSVTSIGSDAFRSCSLTSVVIPDSVTSIVDYAFENCSNLKQLVMFSSTPPTLGSRAIPDNVQSIYVQQSSKVAYQTATNWTTFSSKIVSDNIYLSFVRFNQKNKKYIDEKFDHLNNNTGPKGDTGPQGPKGDTGPQGPVGPQPQLDQTESSSTTSAPSSNYLKTVLANINTSLGQKIQVSESGTGYVRYSDGTQLCFGHTSATTSSNAINVPLPKPFINNSYGLSVTIVYNGNNWTNGAYIYEKSTTSFKYYKYSGTNASMTWTAVGRWKN